MRRAKKNKTPPTAAPVRKPAPAAPAAPRRGIYPAWIVADENGIAFPAKAAVMPRVRDALVLRTVARKKPGRAKGSPDDHGAR
jgi:hypothetical protein